MTIAAESPRAQHGARIIARTPLGARGAAIPLRDRGLLHALEELADADGVVHVPQTELIRYSGAGSLSGVQRAMTSLGRAGLISRSQPRPGDVARIQLTYWRPSP